MSRTNKSDFPWVCSQVPLVTVIKFPPRFIHASQDCFPQDFCSLTCHLWPEPPYHSSQHHQNYNALTWCHVPLSSHLLQTQETREHKAEAPSALGSSAHTCWLTEWEAKDCTNLLSSCSSPDLSKGEKPTCFFLRALSLKHNPYKCCYFQTYLKFSFQTVFQILENGMDKHRVYKPFFYEILMLK